MNKLLDRLHTRRTTVVAVTFITLWKAFLAMTLQLHQDEAYYWLWSRHLQAGYYDHAPMVAYFIKLTTFFSQSELWVRFSGLLGGVLVSALLWYLALQLFESVPVAAASVIALNVMPLTVSGSIIVTPDNPAFLFWAVAVYALWQVARTKQAGWWYALGAAFGFSLLSKYTGILLAPCVLLFLLFTDERRWLKTIHPYLAFAMGLAMFTPVVYWNHLHDWISFRFQFGHGLGGGKHDPLGQVLEYLGGQMLITGPLLWIAGMVAGVAYLFRRSKEKLFLVFTSLPVILFFAYSSLKKPAGPNWPATGYFTFTLLAAKYLLDGGKARRAFGAAAVGLSLLMSLVVTLHTRFSVLPLAKFSKEAARADATNFFYGYRELGREILRHHPEVRYAIVPSHQIAAEITYYTGEQVFGYVDLKHTRVSQYNLWQFPEDLKDKPGIFVDVVTDDEPLAYKDFFAEHGDISHLSIFRKGFRIRKYQLVEGLGYNQ